VAEDIFAATFFGSTLYQYGLFFLSLLVALVTGKIAAFLIARYGKKLTEKTKTKFDDMVIEAALVPIQFLFFIAGLFIGFNFLSVDAGFSQSFANIIGTLVLVDIAWFMVRIVDGLIKHFVVPLTEKTESKLDDQLVPILSKVSKITIVILAIIIILDNFGYDILAILAGLGIAGLAVAFAAQQTIAEIFGGLNIFVSKPFLIGDTIEAAGITGTVEQVGLRHTQVRDFDGRINVIPNSKVSNDVIKNWTTEPARRIKMNLGLVYGTPSKKIEQAIQIVESIIKQNPNTDKTIRVGFNEFKDSSLNIRVVYYIKSKDFAVILKMQNDINLEIKS